MKLGMVFEGGASRTYFGVGASDAFLEHDIMGDYIIGVSAGIANGVSYVSRQKGRALKIGLDYYPDKRYMGYRHLFSRNKSYYNIPFVFEDIPNQHLPFDYDAFFEFPGKVLAGVTNMESGNVEYMDVKKDDKHWKILVASCSLPLLFPPCMLNGHPYMDGGIGDPIPFQKALDDGCDKMIVLLSRERSYVKEKSSTEAILAKRYQKVYPRFSALMERRYWHYNAVRERLFALEKQGLAYILAPESTTDWHRTERRPERIRSMYDCGYQTTSDKIEEIKRFITE